MYTEMRLDKNTCGFYCTPRTMEKDDSLKVRYSVQLTFFDGNSTVYIIFRDNEQFESFKKIVNETKLMKD